MAESTERYSNEEVRSRKNTAESIEVSEGTCTIDETEECDYQPWFNVKMFLFFLSCFQLVNLLILTYTDSVLSFISKRFQIPYTMASFIPSSYQVGNMIAIIPVSYFGAKWHRPRAICVGVLAMLLGLGICVLPHFMVNDAGENSNSQEHLLCQRRNSSIDSWKRYLDEWERVGNSSAIPVNSTGKFLHGKKIDFGSHETVNWFTSVLRSLSEYYHSNDNLIKASLSTPIELPCNANGTVYNPSILLVAGHVLIGMGSAPMWPLGVSYLDDHLITRRMPFYLGIFIGVTLTGPVAGFLLGSLSSAIYVSIDSHNLKPTDPAWIGAWWLGYVIAAGVLLIVLIPFSFFPASLKVSAEKLKERQEFDTAQSENEGQESSNTLDGINPLSLVHECGPEENLPLLCREETTRQKIYGIIRDVLGTVRRLYVIPEVICAFSSYIMLANLLSGVTTFGSTYIEKQFNLLRISSDMLIGGVCVPLAIAGTFGGGYLMKKFDFTINQTLLFNIVMSCAGTICVSILFGLGCPDPKIAGINLPYKGQSFPNVTNTCNSKCECVRGDLDLVCSYDNITYVSPCYAGCTTHLPKLESSDAMDTYSDCSCVPTGYGLVKRGSCSNVHCVGMVALSMVAAGFGIFILCLCQAPTYAILLRVLSANDKPLAIGILTFLSRILAFIPAPIWFGIVIDKSCSYWGPKCKGKSMCKLYYNRQMRLNYVGACVGCGACYALCFILTYLWIGFRHKLRRTAHTLFDKLTNTKVNE